MTASIYSTLVFYMVSDVTGWPVFGCSFPFPFEFWNPDEWPRWKRRLEHFCLASRLSSEDDSRQVSILLYCMGEHAEDTLASTDISAADHK